MKNIFTEHPHRVGETYFQHLRFALIFGMQMIMGGLACLIHAIFPFLFQKTGSNFLLKMASKLIERMPSMEKNWLIFMHAFEKKMKNMNERSRGQGE